MLVLRRKAGEAVTIDGGIEIRVLEVTPTRVLLGIVAPHEVGVVRKEVLAAREENRRAAAPVAPGVLEEWARIFSPKPSA